MQIQTIKSSLIHKIIPPRVDTNTKHPCLMLLHGRGADENDLLGLSPYLDERLLIISPRAPLPFDFGSGYTWFGMLDIFQPELTSLRESEQKLSQFVDDIIEHYPVDPGKIFILGFSMGTVMGYLLLLTRLEKIAGLIANSGFFNQDLESALKLKTFNKLPLFIAHGTHDPIIPIQNGRRAKDFFSQQNVALTYKEYPMKHEISNETLSDISTWLSQQITII
jgi:phospholipase/carboxylesterase